MSDLREAIAHLINHHDSGLSYARDLQTADAILALPEMVAAMRVVEAAQDRAQVLREAIDGAPGWRGRYINSDAALRVAVDEYDAAVQRS